jgi:hypothetical protein
MPETGFLKRTVDLLAAVLRRACVRLHGTAKYRDVWPRPMVTACA